MFFKRIAPNQSEKDFPIYFRKIWAQRKGRKRSTHLLLMGKVHNLANASVVVSTVLWLIFTVIVWLTGRIDQKWAVFFTLIFLVIMMLSMLVDASLIEPALSEFRRQLSTVAGYLGKAPEELFEIPLGGLKSIAVFELKEIARDIKAMQGVKMTPRPSIQRVQAIFRDRYDTFVFWGLISDTGWSEYFRSSAITLGR